jgi:hypothetical protein
MLTRTPWVCGSRPTSIPIMARPLCTAFCAVPAVPTPPSRTTAGLPRMASIAGATSRGSSVAMASGTFFGCRLMA